MKVATILTAVTTVTGLVSATTPVNAPVQLATDPANSGPNSHRNVKSGSPGRTSKQGTGNVIERRAGYHDYNYHEHGRNSDYWDSPVAHREKAPEHHIKQWCKVEMGKGNKPLGSAKHEWNTPFIIAGWTFNCNTDCTVKPDFNFPPRQGYWVRGVRI